MFGHVDVRKGMPDHRYSKEEFFKIFKQQFFDPRFDEMMSNINALAEVAWKNYEDGRKSPRTVKAGEGYADPSYDLSIEWLETKKKLDAAQAAWATSPSKILIINGSPAMSTLVRARCRRRIG